MTTNQLAAGYYRKCTDRMAALRVLLDREAWSDVIRESQEIVELALKGMLRAVGIDPPKWHDVGGLLADHAEKLHAVAANELDYLAAASKSLRKEREFSFYGDVDFIPTDEYDREDAELAFEQAGRATLALGKMLESQASE
ncbi:MAG: HEPN domain-containing protein [Acidobacteriota bacterium]